MKKFKRIFLIVMDSLGIGAEPDAAKYGDAGSDTFGHISEHYQLHIPNMASIGIANLHQLHGVAPVADVHGYYTHLEEASVGKDTLTGHWEIMGLKVDTPFKTFTDTGFPKELMDELVAKTGHGYLGNCAASGTEILKQLGMEHIATGKMIVYTSADSVLQIAAHEQHFGLQELYRCCEIARDITMKPEYKVGRIIARPFIGESPETFVRTPNRHDYAVDPYGPTVLDAMKQQGLTVISVGKIRDIFNGNGITEAFHSESNADGMDITIQQAQRDFKGMCFVNLVDFDAKWGHRRNPEGYGKEIDIFDEKLGKLMAVLNDDDLVMLTADHGNDPTWTGTDHTREMVPLLIWGKGLKGAGELPISKTFASIGMTVADNFDVTRPEYGQSYLEYLH